MNPRLQWACNSPTWPKSGRCQLALMTCSMLSPPVVSSPQQMQSHSSTMTEPPNSQEGCEDLPQQNCGFAMLLKMVSRWLLDGKSKHRFMHHHFVVSQWHPCLCQCCSLHHWTIKVKFKQPVPLKQAVLEHWICRFFLVFDANEFIWEVLQRLCIWCCHSPMSSLWLLVLPVSSLPQLNAMAEHSTHWLTSLKFCQEQKNIISGKITSKAFLHRKTVWACAQFRQGNNSKWVHWINISQSLQCFVCLSVCPSILAQSKNPILGQCFLDASQSHTIKIMCSAS